MDIVTCTISPLGHPLVLEPMAAAPLAAIGVEGMARPASGGRVVIRPPLHLINQAPEGMGDGEAPFQFTRTLPAMSA